MFYLLSVCPEIYKKKGTKNIFILQVLFNILICSNFLNVGGIIEQFRREILFQYKLNLNIQKHRCKIFFVSRLESWGEKEEVQWASRVELSITWLILILCPA